MCEALDDHEGSVSIGGRLITNFRFADDIVVNAEEEEEAELSSSLNKCQSSLSSDKNSGNFSALVKQISLIKTCSDEDHSVEVKNLEIDKHTLETEIIF